MTHDIFISYSSNDKIVADAVVAALENRGIRCWYAPRDIKAGTDWGESITNAIGECALMLLIFSESSNGSKRVLDEIYYSISEGKTILPFRIQNLDPSGAMRLHLSSRHWMDAYDPSWEAHINKLIDTATSNLEKEVTLSDDMALTSPTSKGLGSKNLPWKLIGGILAVGIVIAGVAGIIKLRGSGVAEVAVPTEEPTTPPPTLTATPISTPTDIPTFDVGLNQVETIFVFLWDDPLEIVMGFTTLLPTQLDQVGSVSDISKAVLSLEDLPPGFQALSLAELGLTKEDLSVEDFTPEFMMDSFVGEMGATDILEQKELAHLNDIGDTSAGLTVVADMEGIPMRMDMAVFRRGIVGAFVLVMYIDGEVPVLTVEEVTNKLDDRIVDVITPGG